MRNILICPISAIKKEIEGSTAFYILCTSYDRSIQPLDNAVWCNCVDTENGEHPFSFKESDAGRIARFFNSIPCDADVFICCDSGESRSPAIAAALTRAQGESDADIWGSKEYHPNMLLFRKMCAALGIFITEKEIEELSRTNRKAFQKAFRSSQRT